MKIYMAAIGDSNDYRTWSGIPYHCTRAGQRAGAIDAGLPLATEGWSWTLRRVVWNVAELMRTGRHGGYQYTEEFLSKLWNQAGSVQPGDIIINCFPLFPESIRANERIRKWFFVDQPLLRLFDYYGAGKTVSLRVQEESIRRERLNYAAAEGIIAMSQWAAIEIMRNYDVPPEKLHIVPTGANFDHDAYNSWAASNHCAGRKASGPLSLVCIAKYWKRKGLDRLLEAFRIASSNGTRIELKVIGFPENEVPAIYRGLTGVRWLGTIDKRREGKRFLQEVGSCDVGCLLSRQETGGTALREFHALGLAVLAPDTGGAMEFALQTAATPIAPDMPPEEIAKKLVELAENPERVGAMKRAAWGRRNEFTWDHAVSRIEAIVANASPSLQAQANH